MRYVLFLIALVVGCMIAQAIARHECEDSGRVVLLGDKYRCERVRP